MKKWFNLAVVASVASLAGLATPAMAQFQKAEDAVKYRQSASIASKSTRVAVSWYSSVIVFRCSPVSRATSLILSLRSPISFDKWHLITSRSKKKYHSE